MLASAFLYASIAVLVSASPLETRTARYFEVSQFSFGCTTTCDYSFKVDVPYDDANHPAVNTAATCSGSLGSATYKDCGTISATQSIAAYIDKSSNQLHLRYEVNEPKNGKIFNYYGSTHVNAETSGKPQAKKFSVKESKATVVA